MTHEELKDLLPLKALDRLETDEERALAEHLANGCDECERELESFREALGALALAAGQENGVATDRIWTMVETRLETERIAGDVRSGGRDRDVAQRRGRGTRVVQRVLGSIAAILAVVLGITIYQLERGVEEARNTTNFEVTALRARIDDLQRGLETTTQKISDLQSQLSLTSTLTLAAFSPDTRVVHLKGLAAAPKANATLAISPSNGTAFMQASGLPPAPEGKVYEAWWIGPRAGPIRAGLFETPAEGIAKVELVLPPEGEEVIASAVTLEPTGGTEKPTGAMYLKGDLTH